MITGAWSDSSSNVVPRDVVRTRFAGGLGVPRLSIDEILLLTEWPSRVVLPASEEIVDSGRGINSTLSENSTRGRDGVRVKEPSEAPANGSARSPVPGV